MSHDASNHLFETVKIHLLLSVQCQKIKKSNSDFGFTKSKFKNEMLLS